MFAVVRGQGADVAVPHLAARRPRRGADRGLRAPGRRAAEARRLRLPALLAADAARRLGLFRALRLHALDRRDRLHLAGRADAERHEEADRLLARSRTWASSPSACSRPTRSASRARIVTMLSHGFVSAALFMVVGVVYDRIHSREIAAYGGLAERDAGLRHRVHAVHAGLGRPARHQRVRRRDPGHRRGVPDRRAGSRFFAATGMILGAAYMLWLYRRVIFGALLKEPLQGHPRPARATR